MSAETIDERIHDIDFAHDAALLENEGYNLMAEYGIQDMASNTVEAHNRTWRLAEAIKQCEPFANMVRAVAENAPAEIRGDMVRGVLGSMAAQAKSVPDAVRAQSDPAAHREYVKKN